MNIKKKILFEIYVNKIWEHLSLLFYVYMFLSCIDMYVSSDNDNKTLSWIVNDRTLVYVHFFLKDSDSHRIYRRTETIFHFSVV